MQVVVIGSGFGGLSAAIRLQAAGHQVTILERRDRPGGRAYQYRQDGFVFDGGPTIITVPQLIEELFNLAQRPMDAYVQLVKLNPFYNVRFEDGSVFHYSDDAVELLHQIETFNPADVVGYERFYQAAAKIFQAGLPLMEQPFLRWTDMLKVAPTMARLQVWRSVAAFAAHYLKDDRLRQVFSFHPLLIGGNPFQSTSIYAMIHRLEQEFGIWFAMGGTGALVQGLVQLFQDIGGTLHCNANVAEIQIDRKTNRATGVRLDSGEVFGATAVVSNADVVHTYTNLLPTADRKWNRDAMLQAKQYSMSLFVVYFGTDRQYDQMAHHEILMGPRYQALMRDIFDRHHLADDFSLYLHRPTATDPSLAPEGCDSWYVLAPVPNLDADVDWRTQAKPYRDRIMAYLEKHYLPELSQHIVTERYIDPIHFRDELNSYKGSAFSVAPTLLQSAWFRPHNRSEDIPNLYLVGAGTHPGAGIPGVMNSGKIAAALIQASTA